MGRCPLKGWWWLGERVSKLNSKHFANVRFNHLRHPREARALIATWRVEIVLQEKAKVFEVCRSALVCRARTDGMCVKEVCSRRVRETASGRETWLQFARNFPLPASRFVVDKRETIMVIETAMTSHKSQE